MKTGQKIGVFVFFIAAVLALSGSVQASFEAALEDTISLILREHPTLVSQRTLVRQGEALDVSRPGMPLSLTLSADVGTRVIDDELRIAPIVGLRLSVPVLDSERAWDQAMVERTYARVLEEDVQRLQSLQEEIISGYLNGLEGLVGLLLRIEGRQGLLAQLLQRRIQLESFVQSGLSEPESLWALDERVSDLRVDLGQLEYQLELGLSELAYNYGGSAWRELKEQTRKILAAVE